MKIGIMQPYFFPYIGYWQLINYCDVFVVYDNIQFTKKGWIKHNRILANGKDQMIGLTLKKNSDYLNVIDRYLSDDFDKERFKILNIIRQNYSKAEYFKEIFPIITEIMLYENKNLFEFIYNSIEEICKILNITTKLVIASKININHELKGKDKVIALTKKLQGDTYINPIGGIELYDFNEFKLNNINLAFLKAKNIEYKQLSNEFVPFLSIIDVLMNNGLEGTKQMLNQYDIYDSITQIDELNYKENVKKI